MVKRRSYSAHDIARVLLAITDPEDNDVSNLKLQKLCYYAQGILSAMRGTPLFLDKIEAWDHGPVVPVLYHDYKRYGSSPIAINGDFDEAAYDPADIKALRDVMEYYSQFSPWRLRNMTHEEAPWLNAYNQPNREIPVDALIAHFRPIIKDDYVRSVYGSEMVTEEA